MKKRESFTKMIFCLSFCLFCAFGMNAQSSVYNNVTEVQERITEIMDEVPGATGTEADVLQKELKMLTTAVQAQDLNATVEPTPQERKVALIAALNQLKITDPANAAIYQRKLDRL